MSSLDIIKTIETELLIITAVAANAQQKSSVLDLTNVKKVAIFVDHGRTATTAFVGAGTEYRVEASQKATGDDTWRTIASYPCGIAAATEITADADEAVAETTVLCSASLPTLGDIVFWENATLANSEWAKVVAIVSTGGSESFTIQYGLTNAQTAAKKIYNKGEHWAPLLDVAAHKRLRVICNNNAGSTNAAIKCRVAAITQS